MNTLTDLLLGVGQPRVSHFPDLCTLLYTYLSTLDYWTKIVYYLFTQTSPVAHTSALTPTYIKSQKLPNWPISKELGLGRMLLPHWKLLFIIILLMFVPKGLINDVPSLVPSHYLNQWWHNLLTHICVAQHQWVNVASWCGLWTLMVRLNAGILETLYNIKLYWLCCTLFDFVPFIWNV